MRMIGLQFPVTYVFLVSWMEITSINPHACGTSPVSRASAILANGIGMAGWSFPGFAL